MKKILLQLIGLTCVDITCTDPIAASDNKYPCGEDVYEQIYALFIAKPGASISAVGSVPTVAEVTTAMGLSTDAKVICIGPLYDATKAPESNSIDGPDGLKEVVSEKIKISGSIKNMHDDVIDGLRQNNIRQRYQMWYVLANGRWIGAKDGFRSSIYFPDWSKEAGKSSKADIKVEAEYWRKLTDTYVTAVDPGYLDLNNE